MRVLSISELDARPRRVALGEFDGVHVGHRAVISGNDTVLTFEPHPATVLRPDRAPKLLTSLELKIPLIAGLGVEELVVVPFDQTVAHQEAADFVTSVLVDTLAVTHLSVGENFRFGHHALGDAALLAADARFQTTVVPLVSIDGVTVSSTLIRSLIEGGDVAQATRLLGAPFKMASAVVPGDQRGRELGFPTANLIPDPRYVCPAHGVYAARVGEQLAAVNVGVRPTFGDGLTPLVEAHLLDFSGDLYGRTLTIEFIDRLRSEVRFETAEQLIAQMRADVERTREVLASGVA